MTKYRHCHTGNTDCSTGYYCRDISNGCKQHQVFGRGLILTVAPGTIVVTLTMTTAPGTIAERLSMTAAPKLVLLLSPDYPAPHFARQARGQFFRELIDW